MYSHKVSSISLYWQRFLRYILSWGQEIGGQTIVRFILQVMDSELQADFEYCSERLPMA